MSWLAVLPLALLVVAWILLPGLGVVYLLGVRGPAAWAAAPPVSIGVLASTALVAGQLGLPWSPAVAAGGALVLLLVAAPVPVLRRRWGGAAAPGDGRWSALAAVLGVALAAALAIVTAALGMGGPDRLSQTYDAVFHYNAVAEILQTGNASSFAVGRLTDPAAAVAIYPAAWHGLVSLVALSAPASVPTASNVVAVVVAGVVWPLSCMLLVRQVTGRSTAAVLLAPVVAVAFIAFPWALMGFGVLWPNLLGLALVPASLAVVVTLCGLARDSALTRVQAVLIGAVSLIALALAHPNTVFSLAVLAIAPVCWGLASRFRALAGSGRWWTLAATALGAAAAAVAGVFLLLAPSLFAEIRAFDWPAYQSPPQAAGEVLLNATNRKDAAWALSLAVVAGAVAAARSRSTRWLLATHLLAGGLFLLASSLETVLAAAATGLWYNDPYRLAAMIPVTGVPLVVLALLACGDHAANRAGARGPEAAAGGSPVRAAVATGAATVLLVVASSGLYVRDHADFLTVTYSTPDADRRLLTDEHRDFLDLVGTLTPPGAVVAQNPWTGSALLWALSGREVLFPHLDGRWTADQRYLADHLDEIADDVTGCAVADRLGVEYALTGEPGFWPWDARSRSYPGLADVATSPGFDLVASSGSYGLYRITACSAPIDGTAG